MRRFRINSFPDFDEDGDNAENTDNDDRDDDDDGDDGGEEEIESAPGRIDTISTVEIEEIECFLSESKKEHEMTNDHEIQTNRIRKIIELCFGRMQILGYLPIMLKNNGEILRQFFTPLETDFILKVCGVKKRFEDDFETASKITNILDKISYRSTDPKLIKSIQINDDFDAYIAQVIHMITTNDDLVIFLRKTSDDYELEPEVVDFLKETEKLRKIIEIRLSTSGSEEISQINRLKSAYRTNLVLKRNISELENLMDIQRQDLGRENDEKSEIMKNLSRKIETLRENFKIDVNQIVYESEKLMMVAYNTSEIKQTELAFDAKSTTQQYESVLEEHLEIEKALRAKCFKVETQLASWLAKYDQDIGDKQAEQEVLQKIYDDEKAEVDALQAKFDEQEEEYLMLMEEKEEEQHRLFEENAYQFLLNRSARRIQRCWRAYRLRKALRKKRKGKRKGSGKKSTGSKKSSPGGKDKTKQSKDKKKAKRDKKTEAMTTIRGGPDPNALLEDKFNKELLEDIKTENAFAKKDFEIDLAAD